MYRRTGSLTLTLVALLALVVTALAVGCSSDPPEPRWEEVTSGSFSGDGSERLDLGVLYLTGEVRLALDLTGPDDVRASFKLEVTRLFDAETAMSSEAGVGSWMEGFAPRSDDALITPSLEPGDYQVTVTQRLLDGARVGYAGTFTLYTQVLD